MLENFKKVGLGIQEKIQNVAHHLDDSGGVFHLSSTSKRSCNGRGGSSGKRNSSGSNSKEEERSDKHAHTTPSYKHQESHISVEPTGSFGETEVRLRSEESIRVFESKAMSFQDEKKECLSANISQEPVDLKLQLLRITTCHEAMPKKNAEELALQLKVFEDDDESSSSQWPDLDVTIKIVQEKEKDTIMILGGKEHCHKLLLFPENSKLHLTLFDKKKKILGESSIALSQLLLKHLQRSKKVRPVSVNRWMALGTNKEEGKRLVKLQLRLIPDSSFATIHKQASCKVLTPGPGMMSTCKKKSQMKSYALRKMALYSVAPVFLHVYDVSNSDKVQNWNYYIKAVGAGGLYHAAVEIYGREYSFGGSREGGKSVSTGIFACPPKRCPMHHYRESVYLGDCELSWPQVQGILNELKPQWLARQYNLLRKNCCYFSQELAIQLGVGNIPSWVYSLAETGQQMEPYLERYFKPKKKTGCGTNSATAVPTATATGIPKQANEAIDSRPTIMLDHAMASRIQRSYRLKFSPEASNNNADDGKETMFDHAMASRIQRSFRQKSYRQQQKQSKGSKMVQLSKVVEA